MDQFETHTLSPRDHKVVLPQDLGPLNPDVVISTGAQRSGETCGLLRFLPAALGTSTDSRYHLAMTHAENGTATAAGEASRDATTQISAQESGPQPLPQAPLAYQNPDFLDSPDARLLRMMAEYSEPMARFRRERIQDTVVFFGSARFRALDVANQQLQLLANDGSEEPAPAEEQPASGAELAHGSPSDLKRKRAEAAVEMARYYEDARTLAHQMATWAKKLPGRRHRFVVTSGGGPGIMEAANRGAWEAGAKTIGLNIVLPFEQVPNRYITPALNFNFHYFFMRKYWFAYLAKALVVFPGGFGTLDEMFELLTLDQTGKLAKKITVVLYGSAYWKGVINMDLLLEKGAIAPKDKDLFQFADTPEEAFRLLTEGLTKYHLDGRPDAAHASESVPTEPAASVQEQLGPDIAKTRP